MTQDTPARAVERQRVRVAIRGAVQGVGFRPFVYRLASTLDLAGWVRNSPAGVLVEVEGDASGLREFLVRVEDDAVPPAAVHGLETTVLPPVGEIGFEIRQSESAGKASALILPDLAVCRSCQADIRDPANRRYGYPFTNCTQCGPRYTIIQRLPYDRPNTTMRGFRMCSACEREYNDPADRRFHAQPIACPDCGPRLALWEPSGSAIAEGEHALCRAAGAIRDGAIVAVKGLGGFHLILDARNDDAVHRLRARKRRPRKPLAIMVSDLAAARAVCRLSDVEEHWLTSPEAPIVLLRKRQPLAVSEEVAPGNPALGVMLAYTPLHVLLLDELGFPIVATSGNAADEPICIDEAEALDRLAGMADLFLVHDRPIARHADDSVLQVVMGREQVVRSARGLAPLPVRVGCDVDGVVAVGGHLKNAVAVGVGRDLVVSQHIGDLDSAVSCSTFDAVVEDLQRLYDVRPVRWVHDLHPDYWSTRRAADRGPSSVAVQHHFAHVGAVLAEHDVRPPIAAVSWDGTGYGGDGTIWGGEFITVDDTWECTRSGRLRTFPLPGGEAAIREPWRAALGVLYELYGDRVFSLDHLLPVRSIPKDRRDVFRKMLARGVNAPMTSSMGRLFDAVASILGLCAANTFEGEAAAALESAADASTTGSLYPFWWASHGPDNRLPRVLDWGPMVLAILHDLALGWPVVEIAGAFHSTVAEFVVSFRRSTGSDRMALCGGCFQNRRLTERAVRRLREEGCRVYWPQRVPPGDGGLCVGQAVIAGNRNDRR